MVSLRQGCEGAGVGGAHRAQDARAPSGASYRFGVNYIEEEISRKGAKTQINAKSKRSQPSVTISLSREQSHGM